MFVAVCQFVSLFPRRCFMNPHQFLSMLSTLIYSYTNESTTYVQLQNILSSTCKVVILYSRVYLHCWYYTDITTNNITWLAPIFNNQHKLSCAQSATNVGIIQQLNPIHTLTGFVDYTRHHCQHPFVLTNTILLSTMNTLKKHLYTKQGTHKNYIRQHNCQKEIFHAQNT